MNLIDENSLSQLPCHHGPGGEDLGDRSYKLLCPALRESLAAQVLRENLKAQARTDIEPDCPYMRDSRDSAIAPVDLRATGRR